MKGFRVVTIASVVALMLTVAGCGSSSKKSSSSGGVSANDASGANTVNVTVSDTKGTDAPMTLTATPTSASSGDVTFTVKNTGTVEHEVVVLKTDTAADQLKVGGDEPDKVDESDSVGETGDPGLKPGETRSFTVKKIEAGNYVLVCNIAKHYGLGMRSAFKVS